MAMNALLLLLYAAASVAYAVQFSRRTFATSRLATVLLVLAAFAHTFVIGMETMRVGHVPSTSATSAILSFVWLLSLSYLYLELTTGERAMGVFILPLLVALQAIPTLSAAFLNPDRRFSKARGLAFMCRRCFSHMRASRWRECSE